LLLSLILTVSALLLNNYLVPLYGMEGAAISNLLSYGLYYLLIIATVVPFCRLKIIDTKWWLILMLLAALFALNWAMQTYLPPMNIWLDSILRSLVIIGIGAFIAYKAKLSPEINQQLCGIL
jgi:O-antigen/teichoic acid export membrane protein